VKQGEGKDLISLRANSSKNLMVLRAGSAKGRNPVIQDRLRKEALIFQSRRTGSEPGPTLRTEFYVYQTTGCQLRKG